MAAARRFAGRRPPGPAALGLAGPGARGDRQPPVGVEYPPHGRARSSGEMRPATGRRPRHRADASGPPRGGHGAVVRGFGGDGGMRRAVGGQGPPTEGGQDRPAAGGWLDGGVVVRSAERR